MSGSSARVLAIARREWRSAFVSPSGWIVLSIVGAVAAVSFFGSTFVDARPATLRTVLLGCGWALLVTAPALSMRSFSEEFRLKTWETLFASPLSTREMVLGKALACAAILAASIAPVGLLALPLEYYASPDYGELACGLLGLFLAGFAAMSLGIAVSSTTASQAVAFLGAFFLWLGLVAGSRILVSVLPIEFAPIAAGVDPIRRLEGFALGLFDSGSVAYFLAIAFSALTFASVSLERVRHRVHPSRIARSAVSAERGLFVLGIMACATSATWLLSQPGLRVELDATKTRAYSLAPSTERMFRELEGKWRILLFVDARQSDPGAVRQIDEVLERFREANPAVDARRIDPADPSSAGAFEEALASIVAERASDLARCEEVIQRGLSVYDGFRSESASQPAGLRAAAQQLPQENPARRTLEQLAAMFAQVATEGDQYRKTVAELVKSSASRPLPDIEGARSALARGFRVWGDQLASASTIFAQWGSQQALPAAVRNVVSSRVGLYEALATRMAEARAELEALPELELDALGRELVNGEAAVVVGNGRLAVIPAWRIFPKSIASDGADRVSYSWGFRGEEVLSGAVRSIASSSMPEVVFLHSERDSLLRPRQDNNDLVAIADALKSAGFGVREWVPSRGERPAPTAGRPQVFVVLPALRRAQLDLSREERIVVESAVKLIADGQPVLVTAGRSMLSVLGQPDPWQEVLAPLGLSPDAGRIVLELVAREDGAPEVRPWQLIERIADPSPLAERLRGRALLLNQPIRVRMAETPPTGVQWTTAVSIAPSPERWLADDWRGDGDGVREIPAGKALAEAIPVVVLAERKISGGSQRAILVGSGGWLLSNVADLSDSLGGGRTALVNPGNRELLLASVAWLSDRGDLLGAGLSGREVPRIEGLGDGARLAWAILLGALLAFGPLAVGSIVISRRRGRA